MRDYGFGRRDPTLEDVVAFDIKQTIDIVANGPQYPAEKDIVKGNLVYLHYLVAPAFINGLLHVLCRTTLPRSEYHKLLDLARHSLLFQKNSDDFGGALSLTPSLKDIAPKMSGYENLVKGNQCMVDFFTKIVNEALETHDESYDRHFLDIYITKMKEEQRNSEKTTYSVEQLIMTCVDYMLPTATGGETVLTILLEHIMMHPEVQDKVHEEIDRVVGRERLPTLDDRPSMPYTEACIREALRMDPIVPMGVPHRATKATTFAGYDLPENCALAVNYVALGFDKELWGDPEVFRPERFIENGKISPAKDKSLPFGAGRRLCAGETFSRQIMFQVFAGLMQAFSFSPAGGQYTERAARVPGIIISMPELWFKATPR
ncbi:cytochrome p450 domain-containing protein [Phthorimaea operculella]|nr:cytochrome p450 domain-containing protein [Phthorimaea operculella]